MNYWLIKSEPYVYSYDDLTHDKKTSWDGVRNYAARNYMREMKKGDQVFFYHSNEGKQIVGIATISKEAYPDPTAVDNKGWVSVEIKPLKKLKKFITLVDVRVEKILSEMELVKNSRLSVQKVSSKEWIKILKMAGE
ncbi:MAG: EVE domain-containing protein [Chitinophagaceae bacterium]|nr:EVE domain-containing protein [Chitinophagaceae bacterium]